MNSANRNIAIEKNRAALLRLVRCWLMIAMVFGLDRVLPRRIGLWVSDIIFTAEKATYYLQIASGYGLTHDAMPVQRYAPLTIRTVIIRLKAVKKVLVRLKQDAGVLPGQYHFLRSTSRLRNVAYKLASFAGLHLRAIHCCRAPPSFILHIRTAKPNPTPS